MSKVWIVEHCDYDEHENLAVFADKAAALAFFRALPLTRYPVGKRVTQRNRARYAQDHAEVHEYDVLEAPPDVAAVLDIHWSPADVDVTPDGATGG